MDRETQENVPEPQTCEQDAQSPSPDHSADEPNDLATQYAEVVARRDDLAERHDILVQQRDEAQAHIADMQKDLDYLQHLVEAMEASHSWKLTAPLRQLSQKTHDLSLLPKTALRRLNRLSQVSHQKMKRRHPRTAEALRRVLQPLMVRANMRILNQYSVPAPLQIETDPENRTAFTFDYQRPRIYDEYRPLVTIIVPNFNHADYLRRRLESIFAQTYDNFEVLLLDDCSSDSSREILTEFAERYPHKARTLFNEVNSGGVFHQWEKGLSVARGELIWMAESDDWASPNFLETLVPFFQNEGIQLAYARTIFMNGAGDKKIWSMEEYLHEFNPQRWGRAWVETAANIVRDVFSITNIVPNVSSAVFRPFERMDVLEIERWRSMRTSGDWMFYLNVIRGGMMAYSPDAQNFYRIHEKNTSVSSHKANQFYQEHEEVAKCVRRHYRVPEKNYKILQENLRHHWKITRDDYDDQSFESCFSLDRIAAEPPKKPGLLMVGYGFCSGGGETFPIQLANEMKVLGYDITFLDCEQEPRIAGVRKKLATDIPVISNFPDINRIVENFDIEVIHSHHGWADNTILDLLPEESPVRTVITLHGFYETVPSDQLKLQLPRLLKRTDAMVYIADKNLTAMHMDPMAKNYVFDRIDNAVSRTKISPIPRAALGIDENAFVMTLVSRALHTKGWAEAIEATRRAREICDRDIQLVLVGDGEAKDAAQAAGVPSYVHLEGFHSNTQDYFATADIGILPSRFPGESFPLVIIECLNAGTPVLASDIGEIRHMLTTEHGIAGALFDLQPNWEIDIEALAEKISELATSPQEISNFRSLVPEAAARFDPHLMAEKYDAVYTRTNRRKK